jgi:hypothetical protein
MKNELERLFNEFEKGELGFFVNGLNVLLWHVLIAVIIFVACSATVGYMESTRNYQFDAPPVHIEKIIDLE